MTGCLLLGNFSMLPPLLTSPFKSVSTELSRRGRRKKNLTLAVSYSRMSCECYSARPTATINDIGLATRSLMLCVGLRYESLKYFELHLPKEIYSLYNSQILFVIGEVNLLRLRIQALGVRRIDQTARPPSQGPT
ncbi:hypothetical protein F4776DRAFT_645505 [Hypoxylon sp. NC0597]|nr:hypothetical protein F4776DRAFT_645505 [Hypoxylon sp. NC0597]